MKYTHRFIYLYMFFAVLIVFGCTTDKKVQKKAIKPKIEKVQNTNLDCVEFVALWPAGDIAKKLGKDKKWVFLNYTVTLWDIPPTEGESNSIGKLRASSYARIIEKRGDDYKVESPMNQVHGWINKEHVKTISMKNPKTKALCQ